MSPKALSQYSNHDERSEVYRDNNNKWHNAFLENNKLLNGIANNVTDLEEYGRKIVLLYTTQTTENPQTFLTVPLYAQVINMEKEAGMT